MTLGLNFIGSGLGACGTLAVKLIIDLTGRLGKSLLHFVQSPFGVFALGKSFPEVLLFFLEKIRIVTDSLGSMA